MIGSFNLLKRDLHINNSIRIEFLPNRRHAQSIMRSKRLLLYKEIIAVDRNTCTNTLNRTTAYVEVLIFK